MKLPLQAWPIGRLTLLTAAAVAIHGYHLGVDDGGVYLPAVVKSIHPGLYPYGAEFFESHSSLSQFAALVGATARLFHLNSDWAVFLWHLLTVFAFLLAAWRLASVCFNSERARWAAVLLIAAVLTVPVAGTALVLMDPYLTARSASTPLSLFAVAAMLGGLRREAVFWLALTALVHPLMAAYAAECLAILALPERWTAPLFERRLWAASVAAAFPAGFSLEPTPPAYRQAIAMRSFLFLPRWTWYEWLGVAAPLGLLILCGRWRPRESTPAFNRISRGLSLLGLIAIATAALFASTPRLESFLRLQPMRAFHLISIVFFLLLGGLLGEYLLKSRSWLWIGFFATVAACLFTVQRKAYAHSSHIEWPGAPPKNTWVSAFLWIRDNTPPNAVFALDPDYIELAGEDQHGFRGLAQRSVLSDHIKDSGVVSLFPQLAPEWAREQAAQQNFTHFQMADFGRLAKNYPVSWVVLQGEPPYGLKCPYRNETVVVCYIPGASGLRSDH